MAAVQAEAFDLDEATRVALSSPHSGNELVATHVDQVVVCRDDETKPLWLKVTYTPKGSKSSSPVELEGTMGRALWRKGELHCIDITMVGITYDFHRDCDVVWSYGRDPVRFQRPVKVRLA